jgi:hypothetical protein
MHVIWTCALVLERVEDTVKLCAKYRDSLVVGVDMAGDESLPLDPRHVAGFHKAKEMGLHVTVHAAESGPASNVKQAVLEMGAERIGHGYNVLRETSVYQFAKDRGVHFEVSLRFPPPTHTHASSPLLPIPPSPYLLSRHAPHLVSSQTPASLKTMPSRSLLRMV